MKRLRESASLRHFFFEELVELVAADEFVPAVELSLLHKTTVNQRISV